MAGDSLMRDEEGRRWGQRALRQVDEIAERLGGKRDHRMHFAPLPGRQQRRRISLRSHPPVAFRVLDACAASRERLP